MIRLLRRLKAHRQLYELCKGINCGKHKGHKSSDVAAKLKKQ